MLALFPMEYWIVLAVLSLVRVVSSQVVSHYLVQFTTKNRPCIRWIDMRSFHWYMKINGVSHLVLLVGFFIMFYILYDKLVHVVNQAHFYLQMMNVVSIFVIIVEFMLAAVSFLAAVKIRQAYITHTRSSSAQ